MIALKFSTGTGFGSGIIRWFTWSKYSHVDLILPNGTLLGALQGKGVGIREDSRGGDKFTVNCSEEVAQRVLLNSISFIGKEYDWWGAFAFGPRRDWQDSKKWFCSELIVHLFAQAGLSLLNTRESHRISPAMLVLSPYLRRICDEDSST